MFIPGGPSMAPFRPTSTTYMPKPELPPHLQSLFNPRPPLPFIKAPIKPKCRAYTGLADYVDMFEEGEPPARTQSETPQEKRLKDQQHKRELFLSKLEEDTKNYLPKDYPFDGNPHRTLFVCRLDHETTDIRLKKEFEIYGVIKSVKIIRDLEGKSRGYGFVEFENDEDFKNAYKYADGRRIDNKRVLVDFERGRTSKGWKPRRLGGGKGNTRAARPKGEKCVVKNEFENIYDESRGYKAVHSNSRSRSRKRDGRNRNNENKRRDERKNDIKRSDNPRSR
jgi:U1 small nuclear ribonucleoprotein 70kDa